MLDYTSTDVTICKAQKPEQKLPHGIMGSRMGSTPFQIIAADLMGSFPLSKKRKSFLLVVTDTFSKYSLLFPLTKATAVAVKDHIENDVILVYGCPQYIICDNGK